MLPLMGGGFQGFFSFIFYLVWVESALLWTRSDLKYWTQSFVIDVRGLHRLYLVSIDFVNISFEKVGVFTRALGCTCL